MRCLTPVKIWYQNIKKLNKMKKEKNVKLSNVFNTKSKPLLLYVVMLSKYKLKGKVTKNTYIPDNLCVIDDTADMGKLIFLKSI